ncbi:MAG: phosphate acetyltransferase [Candidatus Gracilibacteria bacterium]
MDFLKEIKSKAKTLQKRIVFPESFDDRTLQALEVILNEQTAQPILLGKTQEIQAQAAKLGLKIDWNKVKIIDPKDPTYLQKYTDELYNLRKDKGLTKDQAAKLLENHDYFGVMAVHMDDAEGMISGAVGTTAETVLPALQIIKTKEKFHKVSGIFFMVLEKRLLLFADCAVNIEPDSHELADIAIDTAETALRFGLVPKIAMLSFSTNGSAKHPLANKVREATQMVKFRRPDLIIDGEMQVDAALVPNICATKFPGSALHGDANILIFPDLQAGNIAYKLVERLAGAKAIGPILQGLQKPINDLSRGCSFHDIADLAAFTSCESQEIHYELKAEAMHEIVRSHKDTKGKSL